MEKPDTRKEININLTPSQIQTLVKINFAPIEHVKALNKLKILFYSTRLMCVFYQEEVAPEGQLYKTKFIQYKFWANKITGGQPHEQQPYLKPISKQNMEIMAAEFGFELPEPSSNALELKRKNEQVAQLESTVGELTKKLMLFENLLKASLSEKPDLSQHLSNSIQASEDEKISLPQKKKQKVSLEGGKVINKNNLGKVLGEAKGKKEKKSAEKQLAALASANKKNQGDGLSGDEDSITDEDKL
jgi:hypothetical protein